MVYKIDFILVIFFYKYNQDSDDWTGGPRGSNNNTMKRLRPECDLTGH